MGLVPEGVKGGWVFNVKTGEATYIPAKEIEERWAARFDKKNYEKLGQLFWTEDALESHVQALHSPPEVAPLPEET